MILLDANVLLYAYDSSSPHHAKARDWLSRTLSGEPDVRIALVTVLAFIRIATNPRVFAAPLSVDEAIGIVERWLELPNVSIADPVPSHWGALREAAFNGKVSGPGVMDAHLCALAMQSGATLCSTDKGFARFDGLRLVDPLRA